MLDDVGCHTIPLEWENTACLAETVLFFLIHGLIEILNNFTAYYKRSAHFMAN